MKITQKAGILYSTEKLFIQRVFFALFNKIPSAYVFFANINPGEFKHKLFKKYGLKTKNIISASWESHTYDNKKTDHDQSQFLLILEKEIILKITNRKLVFFFSLEKKKKINIWLKRIYKILEQEGNIYLIEDNKEYIPVKIHLKKPDINLDLFYNNDIKDFIKELENFLSDKTQWGIALLLGRSGTGKTMFLKHIITTLKHNFYIIDKKIYTDLCDYEFYSFVNSLKNPVLVIEFCDEFLRKETFFQGNSLKGLLKIQNSLLGTDNPLKIICKADLTPEELDKELLEEAEKVIAYLFKELPQDKLNKIAEKYGLKKRFQKKEYLSEVLKYKNGLHQLSKQTSLGFKI